VCVSAQTEPIRASVVINNHNYERFLREATDSALAQTHPNTEVIVVDDGSTDGSREIIESYGSRVQRVLKQNGGQGSAINAGFAATSGDIVIFLDADDALHPHAVATVLEAWREGTAMLHFRMDVIDASGRRVGVHPPPWQALAQGDLRDELLRTGGFATTVTSGLAFPRRTLERTLPMPEEPFRLAADGYLVRSAAMLGPIQALDQRLSRYRRHGANDSALSASAEDPAAFFRKKIAYVRNEHEAVRELAHRQGLHVGPDLGDSDVYYLGYRLFSRALDPGAHPLPGDRQGSLLRRYLELRLQQQGPPRQLFADIATALGVSVLPAAARAQLVRWRLAPDARPAWLRRLVAKLSTEPGAVIA